MSYSAFGEGTIIAKDNTNVDEIVNAIEQSGLFAGDVDTANEVTVTCRTDGRDHYYEDELFTLYSSISHLISGADVEWEGEDGALWKHSYKEDQGWREASGSIVYDEESSWNILPEKNEELEME